MDNMDNMDYETRVEFVAKMIEESEPFTGEEQKKIFDLAKSMWEYDCFHENGIVIDKCYDKEVFEYDISTAGWSDNETIIDALMSNFWIRSLCWFQSNRGGRYIFYRKLTQEEMNSRTEAEKDFDQLPFQSPNNV